MCVGRGASGGGHGVRQSSKQTNKQKNNQHGQRPRGGEVKSGPLGKQNKESSFPLEQRVLKVMDGV